MRKASWILDIRSALAIRMTRFRVRIRRMAQVASTSAGKMPPTAIKPSQGDRSVTNANRNTHRTTLLDIAKRTYRTPVTSLASTWIRKMESPVRWSPWYLSDRRCQLSARARRRSCSMFCMIHVR